MSKTLYNIRLLAFCCAIKAYRRNSVLSAFTATYKIARALKISETTVKKYLQDLEDLGLVETVGNGHKRILGIKQLLPILLHDLYDQNPRAIKHLHFFAGLTRTTNYRQYVKRIDQEYLKLNTDQQEHIAGRKKAARESVHKDRTNVDTIKSLMRTARKAGFDSVVQYTRTLYSIPKAVTGKRHLSSILGCSPSTASKRLKQWADSGDIIRRVVRTFQPASTVRNLYLQLEMLKRNYPTAAVIYSRTRNGFFINKGSEVSFPDCRDLIAPLR